jgi:tetratricopeptide (TPR) repeat protein
MAEKQATENQESPPARPTVEERDIVKARKWFERATQVADTRNYDYAIECFINGLDVWPEAVEEGHRPLWMVALQRKSSGGKKPGLTAMLKLPGGKDLKRNMLAAETLLAKDPSNIGFMHNFIKAANKGQFDQTLRWFGPTYLLQLTQEKKPSESRLKEFAEVFEEAGHRCQGFGEYRESVEALQMALRAAEALRRRKPNDMTASLMVKDISGKLAIVKGKFDTADDFRDSLQDAEAARDLHDVDRLVQTDTRLDQLIAAAKKDYEANPNIPSKLLHLVDLLCRRETDAVENEAIRLLDKAFADAGSYEFKQRADDIRLKLAGRKARTIRDQLKADPQNADLRQQALQLVDEARQLKLKIFEERVAQYPTNLRIRFAYAECLLEAKEYDTAIPEFQAAQADPRSRLACKSNIGQCFFQKGYFDQAIQIFGEAIGEVEVPGDVISKKLHYWLGRALEAKGDAPEAMKVYGQLLQWDYNYGDVRDRMDVLRAADAQKE